MKYLLLSLPLALMACVKPDCVVYVNGQPVYSQCYQDNDSNDSERSAPDTEQPDTGAEPDKDNDHGNNGNKSNDHSDDSNGGNSDEDDN